MIFYNHAKITMQLKYFKHGMKRRTKSCNNIKTQHELMTSKAQGKMKHVVVTQTTVIIIICMLNSIREDDVDHQQQHTTKSPIQEE